MPNKVTTVLFMIYLIVLYWILVLKLGVQFSYMGDRSVNLRPFSESSIFTAENILNVLIFVPLGIYADILFNKWILWYKLLLFFSLSLLVEVLQYSLRIGAFDVTDIITNTLGGIIGLVLFKGTEKAISSRIKAQILINKIAVTGTILMILLLVLLKMNMLPIRYQ